MTIDSKDKAALELLMSEGRLSWADLGRELDLSPPATADRVRRLEAEGLIRGYAALADPVAVGLGITAFVSVTLEAPGARQKFLDAIADLPNVLEAHHVAGDHDYLLKVRTRDLKALDVLINEELKERAGIARSYTTIVLDTAKETVAFPVDAGDEPG
jgi:Lrp/AsnC family transcriptional regulator, leucine-responsive regulatory protein